MLLLSIEESSSRRTARHCRCPGRSLSGLNSVFDRDVSAYGHSQALLTQLLALEGV